MNEDRELSRRDLLRGGAALLGASVIDKVLAHETPAESYVSSAPKRL